jgi:hypothetical protein
MWLRLGKAVQQAMLERTTPAAPDWITQLHLSLNFVRQKGYLNPSPKKLLQRNQALPGT